jgi:beta-phosphoglucomutase
MGSFKACLFDLDGVIVDTVEFHFEAWKSIADELGIPFSEEQNEQLKGVSRVESMRRILAMGGKEVSDEELMTLTDRKNERYVQLISQMTSDDILPGVESFIHALKERHIDVAIGSSSKNTPTILKAVGLEETFPVVVDGNSITESKPHPEVFLKGAIGLGHNPSDCLVIEDAVSGVKAAHSAGMKCIGVGDEKILGQADLVVTDLTQLDVSDLETI